MGSMFGGAPPPPPPPAPPQDDPNSKYAQDKAAQDQAKAKGRASTILTGPMGLTSPAPTSKQTLLGN